MGPINWAGRTAYVEATVNTVQEGNQSIVNAVVEKRTKAWGPGYPCRITKVMRTPTMAYDIEEWMWGVEDASKVEARDSNAIDQRPEQRNTHPQHVGQGSQWHRRQGRPQFLRDMSSGSLSSGGVSSNWGSN